jgi:hypothetical protein
MSYGSLNTYQSRNDIIIHDYCYGIVQALGSRLCELFCINGLRRGLRMLSIEASPFLDGCPSEQAEHVQSAEWSIISGGYKSVDSSYSTLSDPSSFL